MPIQKRGGGTVTPKNAPKPKPAKKAKPAAKRQPVVTSMYDPPKPKPKLNVPKRKAVSSEFVYTEQGVLVVKTPAECTRWSQAFRLRIIRDYISPKTMRSQHEFMRHFVLNGAQDAVYDVAGHKVMVKQPFEQIDQANQVIVLRTDVHDLTTGRKMFLKHSDPAMRILMVYEFLHQREIGGVPKLRIAEIDGEW